MQPLCLSQLLPRRRIALVLAASMSCAGAYAADTAVQESDVERLTVYGEKQNDTFGSKSGILLKALPQSVQLLDVDSLRAQGLVSVGDLLRDVPGANPGYSRVGPYQSFSLKIRGFMADQMRNGMRQRYFEDVDALALHSMAVADRFTLGAR